MQATLDILFRVIGTEVPSDHGYALYAALSRLLETEEDQWMHGNPHIGLHTVRGTPLGNGKRLVGPNARLGLRLPSDLLPRSLKLAGKSLELDGCRLRVGVGETRALDPAAASGSPWPRGTPLPARCVIQANGIVPTSMSPLSTQM